MGAPADKLKSADPEWRNYILTSLATDLAETDQPIRLKQLLTNADYMQVKLASHGINALLEDYFLSKDPDMRLVMGGLRLSGSALEADPALLWSQLHGRLAGSTAPAVQEMLRQPHEVPWLRPITPTLVPPGGPLLRTLWHHTDELNAVAITPDGETVVAGSSDGQIRAWRMSTGRECLALQGHEQPVTAVAVTDDGSFALSGSKDGQLKSWRLDGGIYHSTVIERGGSVRGIESVPGTRFAIASISNLGIRFWDLVSDRERRSLLDWIMTPIRRLARLLNVGPKWSSDLALTAGGREIVLSTKNNHRLVVWEIGYGRNGLPRWKRFRLATLGPLKRTIKRRSRTAIFSQAVSADGRWAVSRFVGGTPTVWDLTTGEERALAEDWTTSIRDLVISSDGAFAVSGDDSDAIRVWDLAVGEVRRRLTDHTGTVSALALAADDKTLVSAAHDGTVKVWDLSVQDSATPAQGHTGGVRQIILSRNGKTAVTVAVRSDGTVKTWELSSGRQLQSDLRPKTELRTWLPHPERWGTSSEKQVFPCDIGALMPDDATIITGDDTRMVVWNLETAQISSLLTRRATCLAISQDGNTVVSGTSEGHLNIWAVKTEAELEAPVNEYLAIRNKRSSYWNERRRNEARDKMKRETEALTPFGRKENQPKFTLHGPVYPVRAVDISADGRTIIMGSGDGTLRVWEFPFAPQRRRLGKHRQKIFDLAISSDGRLGFSASAGDALGVWELDRMEPGLNGASLVRFSGPLVANQDGSRFLSANKEEICHHDRRRRPATLTLKGHRSKVNALAVAHDWQTAASIDRSGRLIIWNLERGKARRKKRIHYAGEYTRGIRQLAITPNGEEIVLPIKGALRVINVGSAASRRLAINGIERDTALTLAPDGRTIYVLSDRRLLAWDLYSDTECWTMPATRVRTGTLRVSADGRYVTCCSSQEVIAWDLEENTICFHYEHHHDPTVAAYVHNRKVKLLVPSQERVELHEYPQPRWTLTNQNVPVTAVALATGATTAYSGDDGGVVHRWNLNNGIEEFSWQAHDAEVTGLALSSGGLLVTSGWDNLVHLWDSTGHLMASFAADSPMRACAITPDGHTVLAGDASGQIHFLRPSAGSAHLD